MSGYKEFFLSSSSSVVELETLEITHPNFTRPYRVVRNAVSGLTATLETAEVADFAYWPLRITPSSLRSDLDYSIKIDVGDLGEVLPAELDAIGAADGWQTYPSVVYRAFRSDDLSAPFFGPLRLEVHAMAFSREGCSFTASAPSINMSRTGELFTLTRFPMLRGLL